jgi:hypothetical protein
MDPADSNTPYVVESDVLDGAIEYGRVSIVA